MLFLPYRWPWPPSSSRTVSHLLISKSEFTIHRWIHNSLSNNSQFTLEKFTNSLSTGFSASSKTTKAVRPVRRPAMSPLDCGGEGGAKGEPAGLNASEGRERERVSRCPPPPSSRRLHGDLEESSIGRQWFVSRKPKWSKNSRSASKF